MEQGNQRGSGEDSAELPLKRKSVCVNDDLPDDDFSDEKQKKRTKRESPEEERDALSDEALLLPFTKKSCTHIRESAGIGEPGVPNAVAGRWRPRAIAALPAAMREFIEKTTAVAVNARRKTVDHG